MVSYRPYDLIRDLRRQWQEIEAATRQFVRPDEEHSRSLRRSRKHREQRGQA